jgi:hypothetical protein
MKTTKRTAGILTAALLLAALTACSNTETPTNSEVQAEANAYSSVSQVQVSSSCYMQAVFSQTETVTLWTML